MFAMTVSCNTPLNNIISRVDKLARNLDFSSVSHRHLGNLAFCVSLFWSDSTKQRTRPAEAACQMLDLVLVKPVTSAQTSEPH